MNNEVPGGATGRSVNAVADRLSGYVACYRLFFLLVIAGDIGPGRASSLHVIAPILRKLMHTILSIVAYLFRPELQRKQWSSPINQTDQIDFPAVYCRYGYLAETIALCANAA